MKKHFAYSNQYKNGIDIAFADNTLLFLSCSEAEKNLHTTPNSQRLIDNLAIDNPLMYAGLMLWMRIGVSEYFINVLHLYSFLVIINSVLPYSVGG